MIHLRGITWEHERGYDCMVAASAAYGALNPEVSIGWEFRSLQAFADYPLADLVDNFDLLVVDHPHVPSAAHHGLLAPLDHSGLDNELAELTRTAVGSAHRSYSYAGRQWGLASDVAAQVSAHRPDLIADPPTTWDGVLALASEGRVLWPAKPIDAFSSLISIAGAFGAHPATGNVFLDEEVFETAIELMHRLAERVPRENLTQNPIEVAEALAQSDHACYVPLLFGYSNYSRPGYRDHHIRFRDAPAGPAGFTGSLLGGAGIAVSARSAHQDHARRFSVWVAGPESQRGTYFDAGGQPGNSAAWEDDRLNAQTDDFFRGTRATLDSAYVRPRSLKYLDFQDMISPLVTATLAGEITDRNLYKAIEEAARVYIFSEPQERLLLGTTPVGLKEPS